MASKVVLLAHDQTFDAARVGKIVSVVEGVPLADAVQRTRLQWGILGEHLSDQKIGELHAALTAAGLPARIADAVSVAALPQAQEVQELQWAAEEIALTLRGGDTRLVVPARVRLLAAARFEIDHTRKVTVKEGPSAAQRIASAGLMLATGLPIKIGPKEKAVEKERHDIEQLLWLDIVTADPKAERFRIVGTQLDYGFLKERKTYSAQANFKCLVCDFRARTPAAILNRGARQLVLGGPSTELAYSSEADLERECRWLWTAAPVRG